MLPCNDLHASRGATAEGRCPRQDTLLCRRDMTLVVVVVVVGRDAVSRCR